MKWNRNAWRFAVQAFILIPFIIWEKRTGSEDIRKCYNLSNLFEKSNIKRLFITSFNTSVNTTLYIVAIDFNYIANVIYSFFIKEFTFSKYGKFLALYYKSNEQ